MTAKLKKTVRQNAQDILASLDEEQRHTAAVAACSKLKSTMYWGKVRSILAYLAFGAELDADAVIQAALDEGKNVYVPRISGDQMSFHRVTSLDEPFEKGVFGIREPKSSSPQWNLISSPGPTLVLVPGLAFDKYGARLGRGGGYYDRFISRIRTEAAAKRAQPPLCIGYAYSNLIIDNVPTEDFDHIIDGLVTDDYSGLFEHSPSVLVPSTY